MQNAETILSIIQQRGERGLPLRNIYRMLFNRNLYLKAYAKLYPNKGAMTKGATEETIDGMSLKKINTIIEALRYERYRWTPVKRVSIPKKNGKQRPLGIPVWSDKLLQEVIRSILQEYYEPQFSPQSHGFRPQRGCHTALREIQQKWSGTRWFIEGDISQYFDTIDHTIMLEILKENIHDNRFLKLMKGLLQAGYLEEWKRHDSLSGVPQGGVISPLLSNIYLDKFDHYIQRELIPAYVKGEKRAESKQYNATKAKVARWKKEGRTKEAKELRKVLRTLPSKDPHQIDYRRLRYIRYADDFLLGFAGPHQEAEDIKQHLGNWLREHLKLTLSEEKTLITHATTERARFLGYEIVNQQGDNQRTRTDKRRAMNGSIGLHVPKDVVKAKCASYSCKEKPRGR
jgi:group II intron reverse transcriptase/maturase